MSLPVWECGLKLKITRETTADYRVTPCVGVWIEIWTSSVRPLTARAVTPCVGVWIEIVFQQPK